MQRLVADAQQRAIGNAEAIALRRDGRRFHIDADRARLGKAQRRIGVAQFPIAVVGGDDRARAHPFLEVGAAGARHGLRRAGQGLLHFGDGRDGDFGWQHRVEDMVVAQVSMGKDIVADALAGAQSAAMADHQPRLRPQHGEMVTDRLRVRRPDADIDQGDARAIRGDQMIGGHLVPPPCAVGDQGGGIHARPVDIEPARARERGIAALADL